jgi:exopolysaccharide production protein ExoQ
MISSTKNCSLQLLDTNSSPAPYSLSGQPQPERLATSFPWILFLLTWLTIFALQHRMDAPELWLDGGDSISDVSQTAYDGGMYRQILVVMLGGVGAFLFLRGRQRLRLNVSIAGLLAAYVGWILLTAIWADDPDLTIRRQISFVLMLVFAAGCVARMSVDVLSVFISGIAALNLVPGVIAELRYGNLHPFASDNRFGGTVHPNVQGTILALAIIFLCWWLWRTRGPIRFGPACGSIVLLAFLLMTRSRTSIIAFAAAIGFSVVIVIVRDQRRRLPGLIGALALTIGLVGLISLAVTSNSARSGLLSRISADRDYGDPTKLTGRVDLWQTCLGFAAERPLLGFGFEGFWTPKRIDIISEELTWPINHSHSAYLDELLALGVPGAGLYIMLLLACLLTCLLRFLGGDDRYGACAAVLLFVVIHNVTESINVQRSFPNFAFNLIVLHLALVRPRALQRQPSPVRTGIASRGMLTRAWGNELVPRNSESLWYRS